MCKKYNVNYLHADFDLGYPSPHWGFDKLRVYNFMKRMMLAAICMGTTHFIISEDDVICLNEIQFDESWDIASALHPQTLLAYQKNGQDIPIENGAPLRLASPIKLGYKQSKWVIRVTFTNELVQQRRGYWVDEGYEWFAGL